MKIHVISGVYRFFACLNLRQSAHFGRPKGSWPQLCCYRPFMNGFVLYSYILGLLVSCFVNVANAETAVDSCEWLLRSISATPETVVKSYKADFDNQEYYVSAKSYSVEVLPIYDSRYYLFLKKPDVPWFSMDYSEVGHPNALQGDPRWNFAVFGANTLKYLRLSAYEQDKITYPSLAALNGFVSKLNNKLNELGYEKIPVNFYTQETVNMQIYLEKYASMLSIPLANPNEKPGHFVHDVSFHIASILLPSSYAQLLADGTALALEFLDHLKSKWSSNPPEHIQNYLKSMKMEITQDVDVATAGVSIFVAQNIDYVQSGSASDVHSGLETLHDLLVGSTNRSSNLYSTSVSSSLMQSEIEEFLSLPEILNSYKNYLSPEHIKSMGGTKELLEALKKRHQQVEEAATALLSE